MAGDLLSFTLLSLSSILIIVNPLGATLIYVSLTTNLEQAGKETRSPGILHGLHL